MAKPFAKHWAEFSPEFQQKILDLMDFKTIDDNADGLELNPASLTDLKKQVKDKKEAKLKEKPPQAKGGQP